MLAGFGLPGLGQYAGELAALTAALLWAIAASIFARLGDRVAPLLLNLIKGTVALLLLGTTLLLLGRPFPEVGSRPVVFLMLSGALGIGLGDTFYFRSLALIGARRSLLIESLAPPLSTLLAFLFLGESLTPTNLIGMVLTLGGVLWVVSERMDQPSQSNSAQSSSVQSSSASQLQGLGFGLLAALGQAGGAVLSRAGLVETAMDPLWSTLLRLSAGLGLLLLWLPLARAVPSLAAPRSPSSNRRRGIISLRLFGIIAITAFFSTYLAIWLQQTALKYSPTGIAQALSSTSPLFILPISLALGERLSIRAVAGVGVAIAGIILLFQ